MAVDLARLELPALSDTGASFDAPASPPLRCSKAYDIKPLMSPIKSVRVPIPTPDFAGAAKRYCD